MRLIDADALYDSVQKKWENNEITNHDWVLLRMLIVDAPSVENCGVGKIGFEKVDVASMKVKLR